MKAALIIAGKEFRDGLRNRWAVAATGLMAALAVALAFLGSAPTGHVGMPPLAVTVVSLGSLTVFLVPLIALVLSYDALIGEIERGTMLLLMAYPVHRWEVVVGKFLGHILLLSLATGIGYGSAGAVVAIGGGATQWAPFALLIATSIGLGAIFLSLGYLISGLVRERATAAGLAIGIWLALALLFDLGLLGVLAASQGHGLSPDLFRWIILLNPTDVFRLVNLSSFADVRKFSGLAGLPAVAQPSTAMLGAAFAAWAAGPLAAAIAVFARRQL